MQRYDWPRIVAVWQMAGAALSAASFLDVLPRSGLPPDSWQTALAVLLALCLLAALSGWALYQRRRAARRLALFVWFLQVPLFAVGALRYGLTLGPYVYVGLLPGGIAGVSGGFAPHLALRWEATPAGPATAGVNALAVIAMIVVWRATRRDVALAAVAPAA